VTVANVFALLLPLLLLCGGCMQVRSAMRQSWVQSSAAAANGSGMQPGQLRGPSRAAGKAAPLLSSDSLAAGQPLRASRGSLEQVLRGSREVSPGGRQGLAVDRPTLPLMMSAGSGLRSLDSSLGPLTMGLLASPTMRSGEL